ncbi:MAG: phytanoyl-CoA dioxygenase family protein [Magnetovibrio sp.]|nr:phytanoyl-CoA dioxygenase family protein [Magnetovibrio sp.]
MLTTPVLTDDQLQAFKDDGFLIARGAFDADEMALISAWSDEMLARPEESGTHWVYHEESLKGDGADLVSRIENITPFHDGFAQLTEALGAPVGQLLGEDAELFKEKINFKMPGGDGFKPHQDSQAGWDTYADFFISVLVSIDAATLENGCLELCAGHHQRGLFKSWEPLTDDDMDGMEFKPAPTEPGDIVFFDCYAPHQSAPNMSDKVRRIYYATYNRRSDGQHMAQYYADKHKNYPPDIDRLPDREYVFRV